MIRKLKLKFILLSAASLFLLLSLVVAGMNIINYISVVHEADEVLGILSRNKGNFPDFNSGGPGGKLPPDMSPELPYESRYFSVLLTEHGDVLQIDTSRISAIDSAQAVEYAQSVAESGESVGSIDTFRYAVHSEILGVRITFLDYGRQLDSANRFLFTSICMALSGYLLVTLAIVFLSGKLIRPVLESYEKQKRFITDAGHELKTPLTIIGANADLAEFDLGAHESLDEIRHQAKRLTRLTNDLVFLAKMEESENALPMIDFPLSDLIEETASSFGAIAETQSKELRLTVEPMLSMLGNSNAIEQLVSILLDNALKYSPKGETVVLSLERRGKTLLLSVENKTESVLLPEELSRLFDRFYRTDPSRNSATGGHGIGLSVAKAITEAHGGKLTASSGDGSSLKITASFPV